MRRNDINFANRMTDMAYITTYLLTASMGSRTFYGEVIRKIRGKKQEAGKKNPALRDKISLVRTGCRYLTSNF